MSIIAGVTTFLGHVAQGGAHHRCWHKSKTCSTPPPRDTAAPETTIIAGPSGIIGSNFVSFSSSEPDSNFECRMDVATWSDCASPVEYSGLWNEVHNFRAKDSSDNVDPTPAKQSFEVQAAASPPPAPKATTRPAGSPVLSDAEAASRVRRSSFEPRPLNAPYNSRVPSADDLAAYRAEPTSTPEVQYDKVTGNFTGTTDEIIQWAAHKWGLDEDKVRAVAAQESWWTQSYIGDAGASPGLFQMRHDPTKAPVGHRLARDYTAFNADLYGSFVRYYFDGSCSWCNDGALTVYAPGQEWMSIGAHFNPYPWGNAGQLDYVTKVKNYLTQGVWEGAGF